MRVLKDKNNTHYFHRGKKDELIPINIDAITRQRDELQEYLDELDSTYDDDRLLLKWAKDVFYTNHGVSKIKSKIDELNSIIEEIS